MKAFKVNLFLLVVLCLVLTACTSIPRPTTMNNTLLVVHSIYDAELGGQRALDFFLLMKDDSKHRLKMTRNDNLTFITGLPAGIVTSKVVRASLIAKSTSTSGGRYFDYPIRVETKLEPESYAIFPATITYEEIRRAGGGGTVGINIYFTKIDAAKLRELEHQLEEMGINDKWRKAGS